MMQLLRHEATLFELLKREKNITKIADAMGTSKETLYSMMRRMVQLGMIKRSGTHGRYTYTTVEMKYEIVESRQAQTLKADDDPFLAHAMNVQLTPDQIFNLMMHRKIMKRSDLAKRLGLTKLELNFAIMRLEQE